MRLHHLLWSLVILVGGPAASVSAATTASRRQSSLSRSSRSSRRQAAPEQSLNDALLEKATLITSPHETSKSKQFPRRFLDEEDEEDDEDGDDEDGDDYFNYDYYSLSGFSLKYAKCQTIQRFSEDAIKNGEYSAMVKDDIVILRLCPNNQCSSSKQYGCRYNYAEYALGISDYVKIMLYYTMDRRDKMCQFCANCSYNNNDDDAANAAQGDDAAAQGDDGNNNRQLRRHKRRLEEEDEDDQDEDDQDGESEDEEEEEESEDDEDDANDDGNAEQFDDDDYYNGDDAVNNNNNNNNAAAASYDDDAVYDTCSSYQEECQDIASWCDDGAQDDDVGYLEIEDYLNYLDCVKVEGIDNYGDSNYYIRPRCDHSQNSIHMDVYYDPYCSQYAGNDVNLREFSGIYFQKTIFEKFYSGTCIDCSDDNNYPYEDANSIMCNKLNSASAACTQNMMTQIFDDDNNNNDGSSSSSSSSSIECSFIESVRYGTYNEKGEIYIDASRYGEKTQSEVTSAQTAGLCISILLCVGLGIYSCYLHHSITNLLIKSLSHSHLLPPSRHRSRKQQASSSSTTTRGNKRVTPSDWDDTVGQPS